MNKALFHDQREYDLGQVAFCSLNLFMTFLIAFLTAASIILTSRFTFAASLVSHLLFVSFKFAILETWH
ncbi:hypothetical protein HanPI659440_Chr10g0387011 [Helianthus annuus]|nr:hypothetical protein HanPI659440_Chr10g0387011 [Helianthus annuus]